MRAYWELAKASFRRSSRYRTAVVASVLTNTVFGLIRASLLLAAIRTTGHPIGGYNAMQAAAYVWWGQALIGPIDVWGSTVEIGARVKSGDIAVDFLRPTSILGQQWAQNMGRAAFDFVPRAVPPLVVGALLTGLYLPRNPATWALFVVALLLATWLTNFFYVAVSLSALWLIENRGFLVLATTLQQVLSGFYVPVPWFPPWLRAIAEHSPFPSQFQTVIDILTERITGAGAWQALAVQGAWTLVFAGTCWALLELGRRKVVIQGG